MFSGRPRRSVLALAAPDHLLSWTLALVLPAIGLDHVLHTEPAALLAMPLYQRPALQRRAGLRLRFVEPLPTFGRRRVADSTIQVGMTQFQQRVLPAELYARLPERFRDGTFLWGYDVRGDRGGGWDARTNGDDDGSGPSWPGRTVVAHQGTPTTITYTNNLSLDPILRSSLTIDQTVHWADPLHQHGAFDPTVGPGYLVHCHILDHEDNDMMRPYLPVP